MTIQHLSYFRNVPSGVETNRILCSSLQTFESSLLTLAFRRYPQAIIQMVSAMESLIRANLGEIDNNQSSFEPLLTQIGEKQPRIAECRGRVGYGRVIHARNVLVHGGYSPKDDNESVELVLTAALPFYADCWKELYAFDLFDGLLPDLGRHIGIAQAAFSKAGRIPSLKENRTFSISALAHHLRWNEMLNVAPDGAVHDLLGVGNEGMGRVYDVVRRLENEWIAPMTFDCPACGATGSFVVDFDFEKVCKGEVSCDQALCGNCGYVVPPQWAFMGDLLCEQTFEEEKQRIFDELAE